MEMDGLAAVHGISPLRFQLLALMRRLLDQADETVKKSSRQAMAFNSNALERGDLKLLRSFFNEWLHRGSEHKT